MRVQDFRCCVLFGAGAFGTQAFCGGPENHVVHGLDPRAPMMSISARWYFEIMRFSAPRRGRFKWSRSSGRDGMGNTKRWTD